MDSESQWPCGCSEYHMADCPILAGGDGPTTKDEWLEIMAADDGFYDDHPREGQE